MNQLLGENECEILTHSQQQSQAPKTHKKESTVRLSNQQAQPKEAETVNLTENDAKSLSRLLAWLL